MRAFVVALALLGACASDEEDPGNRIVGVWALDLDDCYVVHAFDADSTYEIRMACDLSAGPDDLRVEGYGGYWHADGEELTLDPVQGTCPARTKQFTDMTTFRYGVSDDGSSLRFYSPSGAVDLDRVVRDGDSSSGGGSVITFGCYVDGAFEPRELERY